MSCVGHSSNTLPKNQNDSIYFNYIEKLHDSNSVLPLFSLWYKRGHVNFLWKGKAGSFFAFWIWKKFTAGKRRSIQLHVINCVDFWVFLYELRMHSITLRWKKKVYKNFDETIIEIPRLFKKIMTSGCHSWHPKKLYFLPGLLKFFWVTVENSKNLFARAS